METIDLKTFRNTNKIQQKDLADYLETTRSFISLVETGKSKLPKSKLSKLLNNQEGWDVSMLRSGVDEMAPDSGSVTIDREAWDVIKSQQSTIEKQQDMLQQMIDMISKKGASGKILPNVPVPLVHRGKYVLQEIQILKTMKKILTFVAAMMAIASCGVMPKERERLVLQNNFDFRRCIENGFVISPYSCHRDCVPIARLDIAVIPAKEFEQETKRVKKMKSVDTSERAGESKFQDGIYNKAVNPKVVKFETQTVTYKGDHISTEIISNEELLDIAMSFIDYYGADALYDFRCEKIYNSVFSKSVGYTKIFDHYSITGVCVKYADPSQVAGGELLSLRSTGTKTGQ